MAARWGMRDLAREAVRGAVGGAAGTGAMSAAAHLRRVRHARRHGIRTDEITEILDYDDSEHVVIAASTLLRHVIGWAPRSERGRHALFWLVHWGYGSAVGAGHAALARAVGRGRRSVTGSTPKGELDPGVEPAAGLAFFAASQAMALGLFPVLGETPPPWRWERRLLVTSFVQHGIYAGTVAAVNSATARLGRRR